MRHLLEIMKIIEGGLNADRTKVEAYTQQLVQTLESSGDNEAAKRIRRILNPSKMQKLSLSRASSFHPSMPVDNESRLSLAEGKTYSPGEIHIFLDSQVQQVVNNFLKFIKGADRLIDHGVDIAPSLLAYGPPGCGKTELARYISARLGLPLLTARMDGLVSSYLGSTAKNIRALFEYATAQPCILLLDDFDAVAKLRDDTREVGELKRVVISLLQNIDTLEGRTILLATTNHPHLLDPAIWRRFAYKVQIDVPTLEARTLLFQHFLGDFSDENNNQLLAEITGGLSGAEIHQLSEDAKRSAILEGKTSISVDTLLREIIATKAVSSHSNSEGSREDQLTAQLRGARTLNPKYFTIRRLEALYGISKSQIHRILHSEG